MTWPDRVRVGLCHLAPLRGAVAANRAALIAAVADAARQGARLIVAPELAVAGYGFPDESAARESSEPLTGPTSAALHQACAELGVWCAAGFLERDDSSGALYNAAMLVSPDGLVGHHRKLVAETRWAARGDPAQVRPLPTPWGPVGLLVCADTYYSGPARAVAARGAQALLVLANWPRGDLDPRRIWRTRAAENGLPVIVANRTGVDGTFDATTGSSAVYDAGGRTHLEYCTPQPGVVVRDVPLRAGRWITEPAALQGRPTAPMRGGPCDVDVAPAPARASIWLAPTGPGGVPEDRVGDLVITAAGTLPPAGATGRFAAVIGVDGAGAVVLVGDREHRPAPGSLGILLAVGGLRVAAVRAEDARHPEVTLSLAQRGAHLLAIPAGALGVGEVERLLLRSLDRTPVCVVTPAAAYLYEPPEDHGAPRRTWAPGAVEVELGRNGSAWGDEESTGAWRVAAALDREALCLSAR